MKKKFVLHRAGFGGLYLEIYKELGYDQNMKVADIGSSFQQS